MAKLQEDARARSSTDVVEEDICNSPLAQPRRYETVLRDRRRMWQVGKLTPDGADDRGGTHANAGSEEAEAAAAAAVDIWGGLFKLVRAQALMRGWVERRAVRKVRS